MTKTLYSYKDGPAEFRIQEFEPGVDCIVEGRLVFPDDADASSDWKAIDSDALCARIYMRAFLEERAKNTPSEDQIMQNLIDSCFP